MFVRSRISFFSFSMAAKRILDFLSAQANEVGNVIVVQESDSHWDDRPHDIAYRLLSAMQYRRIFKVRAGVQNHLESFHSLFPSAKKTEDGGNARRETSTQG
jgi:hypothetical protein